ncbi:MAG: type II 3-dehydroquinate dehydratase [Anaerolineae bacterium]|nr:type II 3-dehydroquinate dehydratase [Anaerolineae bacterium]
MAYQVLVVHGPNLNLLGKREPGIYGALTLEEINERLADYAAQGGAELRFFQSNIEGEIVTALHDARCNADGVVANFGAYTHTSIAIRDAIAAMAVPVVEVHISNVYAREAFRHHSYTAPVCLGTVGGFGWQSYVLGLQGLLFELDRRASVYKDE